MSPHDPPEAAVGVDALAPVWIRNWSSATATPFRAARDHSCPTSMTLTATSAGVVDPSPGVSDAPTEEGPHPPSWRPCSWALPSAASRSQRATPSMRMQVKAGSSHAVADPPHTLAPPARVGVPACDRVRGARRLARSHARAVIPARALAGSASPWGREKQKVQPPCMWAQSLPFACRFVKQGVAISISRPSPPRSPSRWRRRQSFSQRRSRRRTVREQVPQSRRRRTTGGDENWSNECRRNRRHRKCTTERRQPLTSTR